MKHTMLVTSSSLRFSNVIISHPSTYLPPTNLLPLDHPDLHSKVKVSPGGIRFFKKRPSYEPTGVIQRKPRGEIVGFSKASKRSFRDCLMRLDLLPFLGSKDAKTNNGFLVSVDWPRQSYWTQETIANDLDRFAKRFVKSFKSNLLGAVWKKEIKSNGTPHLHVIVLFDVHLETEFLHGWVKQAWSEITLSSELYGVNVQSLYGPPARLIHYLLKDEYGRIEGMNLGRMWGKWRAKTLPLVVPEILGLSEDDYSEMIERFKGTPEAAFSKMIRSFNARWEGGRIIGDGGKLKELLKDLPSEELQQLW